MEIVIKSAKIIDSKSDFNGQLMDIWIKDGKIKSIEKNINKSDIQDVTAEGLLVSPSWIDMHANLQDPGYEYKEDIKTGLDAAAAGGFGTVLSSPLSNPVRDTKAQVEYLLNKSESHIVDALPYGCVSKHAEGVEIAELKDMSDSGAVAFFDGKKSIQNPNLLKNALLYAKAFGGTILNYPNTLEVSKGGIMNEGNISTELGLKGIAELSEELMVARDLYINQYTDGRLHFNTISSSKSLELIKKAKKDGQNVSCDIASYSISLSENELVEFDTRYKTLPPLRSESTILSLIQGIKDGTIDAICSDHCPEDIESKKKELDLASFGIINLQTCFTAAWTALEKSISIEELINLFTYGPANILGLEKSPIAIGSEASITLFQTDSDSTFTKEMVKSKSENSPYFGKTLRGNVIGLINNNQLHIN